MLRIYFEELQMQNKLIFHIVKQILKRIEYISTFSSFRRKLEVYLGGEFLLLKGYLDKPLLNATRGNKAEEDGDKIHRDTDRGHMLTSKATWQFAMHLC